ncbi:unnamed protein product [Peniophora sp. CBMAI 1063]|nr:unnamed protein product [Peniophora sp. CBMAI 1063]
MLLYLPTETIIHVLELVDYSTILSCGATCNRLRAITTIAEPLLYTTTLATSGLRETNDGQYGSLTVSEKLARVREYGRVGSRGGQLVLYGRMSNLSSKLSYGYWITQTRAEDGSLTVSRVNMGGPRCRDLSPQEQLLSSIPGPRPERCALFHYDPDNAIGMTYESEPHSWSLTGRHIWAFNVWDLSSVNATILSSFSASPMLLHNQNWSAYGYTMSYRSGGKHIIRDLRLTEPIQTLEIPYITEPARAGYVCRRVVADDMLIVTRNPIAETPKLRTDPRDFPVAPSYEVHLLNADQSTTLFTLNLPRLNEEWHGATVERSARRPAVDGAFGRMDSVAATYQDHQLFHDHWRFRCPITLAMDGSLMEYTENDVLVCIHVPRVRELLRARSAEEEHSRFLEWDEWAAHARIVVPRSPPVPHSMQWCSSENTTGMRVALWLQCSDEEELGSPESASAARMIALLDFYPHRARRPHSDADAHFPRLALDDSLRGGGMVRPFKDENAYAGGLACAEYTYKLPPDVSTESNRYTVHATTLDGVVITQGSHQAGNMEEKYYTFRSSTWHYR